MRLVTIAALAILAGCTSTAEHIVASGQTFVIATGEQVRLVDGTALRYRGILADSRCRPEVQCIWAGRAELEFLVTPPPRKRDGAQSATSQLMLLATDGDTLRTYGGWQLELVELGFEPLPKATVRVEPRAANP